MDKKTILLTGATDGIGFETAKLLVSLGQTLIIHGRSQEKLDKTKKELEEISGGLEVECYKADFSVLSDVANFANEFLSKHSSLDVLINNAGVLKAPNPITSEGLDLRFAVNTIAPYLLTKKLLALFPKGGRVVNLSSAAQSTVSVGALLGQERISNGDAYAQSKLAITMWTRVMAQKHEDNTPLFIAVNPASLLGSKMVKEGYGIDGGDLRIGADILKRAALSDEFANASGQYYDNDSRQFSSPHPDALNAKKSDEVVFIIEEILKKLD